MLFRDVFEPSCILQHVVMDERIVALDDAGDALVDARQKRIVGRLRFEVMQKCLPFRICQLFFRRREGGRREFGVALP